MFYSLHSIYVCARFGTLIKHDGRENRDYYELGPRAERGLFQYQSRRYTDERGDDWPTSKLDSCADLYFAIRNFFFKRSRNTKVCMCVCVNMCVNIGNFPYTQFEINAKLGRPGEEARQELRASRITHRFFVAISSRKTGT